MAPPAKGLLKPAQLCEALKVGPSMIDDRIARYPRGSGNAFPVEYIGRFRRYDLDVVRAWFAWETADFPEDAIPAAVRAWYATHAEAPRIPAQKRPAA